MSLEHIFDSLEVAADPFALCELQGRCSLGLKGQAGAVLHYVLAGSGEIALPGRPPIPVRQGTLALVPTIQAHSLRSFGESRHPIPTCRPVEVDLASHLVSGDNPESGSLLAICSHITGSVSGAAGVINLVREPLVTNVPRETSMSGPIAALLQELAAPTLGSRALIRAVLLQCAIYLMRDRLLANDTGLQWMAALGDPKLWVALQRMVEAPGDPHSVESLAELAGMSRSSFAERFSRAYGHGPMELLRDLRMTLAASLLEHTDLPVSRIGERVGFQSRTAFTRAFKETIGESPQGYRDR